MTPHAADDDELIKDTVTLQRQFGVMISSDPVISDATQHLPVSQWAVLAGAPVQAGVGGVGRAGEVTCLSASAAATRRCFGRQRHQRDITGAESNRGLAE